MIFNHLQAVQTQTLRSEIRTGRCVSLALSFQDEQTITRNQMNQKNLKFEKFEPVFSNMSGKINWSPAVSSSTCKYDKWRIPGLSWWIGWWGFRFSNRRPTPWLLNLNLTEVGSRKCLDHVGQKNPSPSKSPIFTWFSCWKSIHLAAYGLECSNRGFLGGCRCEGLGMLWLMTMVYVGQFFNIPLMWPKVSIIHYKYIYYIYDIQIWHTMTMSASHWIPLTHTNASSAHDTLKGAPPRDLRRRRSTCSWANLQFQISPTPRKQ